MNKLKGSLAAKIVAIVLLAAFCLVFTGAVSGIAWLDSEGAYRGENTHEIRTRMIDEKLIDASFSILDQLSNGRTVQNVGTESFIRFELLDKDGQVLAGNLSEDETVLHSNILDVRSYLGGLFFTAEDAALTPLNQLSHPEFRADPGSVTVDPNPTPSPAPVEEAGDAQAGAAELPEGTRVWSLRLCWTDRCESESISTEMRFYEAIYPYRYELIAVAAVSFVLAVLLFVFLMAAAGHHDASGEVKASFVEKIPADLLLLVCLAGIGGCFAAINEIFSGNYLVTSLTVTAFCLLGAGLFLLLWLMSAAVRLKLGTFLKSCLVWRVLAWCWKWVKAGCLALGKLLKGLPLVAKWVPPFLILFFLDFACTMFFRNRSGGMIALGLIFKWLLAAAAILYLVLALRRLRDGTKAIAQGDETVTVDTKYLIGDLKEQAEDLNHIRGGLSRAVDERMKSERLRTELITNVSHDIKTPLTSIVNYVDLLAREEPENEKTREYVEVLQRQSARLKKLTDDLVEASKASTGNLPVSMERLELGVLLDQTAGEYGERLAEKQLDLRVSKPEEPVTVKADPRHLWRILDNLLNNVLKYAQPGTRVYLDLTREGGGAALSFRNISAQPLNIRPEELTERFVRGDSARSTEGSGLGLAIASSLAKLQGIDMALAVDGDLFKVVLRLDAAE